MIDIFVTPVVVMFIVLIGGETLGSPGFGLSIAASWPERRLLGRKAEAEGCS
jgi:hypothetical protein